jgi:predicted glutamine amidotransferase
MRNIALFLQSLGDGTRKAGFVVTDSLKNEIMTFLGKYRKLFLIENMPSSNRLSFWIERYLESDQAINYEYTTMQNGIISSTQEVTFIGIGVQSLW